MTAAVSRLGGNVLSSQQSTKAKSGFLTIIASCDIDQVGLLRLLYDLEAGQPFLFIDQLSVQAPASIQSSGEGRPRVLLSVSGQWQGPKIMRLQILRKCSVRLALLLATAVAVPAPTRALPTDAPDLNAPRYADDSSISTVREQPATPTPVIVVRPPEAQPPAPGRVLSPNPLWEIPFSSLSTTRERPIFSPSRRPPPPVVAAAPPAPLPSPKPPRVERPQLSLVGTVDGGDESYGIFVDQTTKAALRLRIGEDHRGWKLRAVHGREVMLERDQQTTILVLLQPGASALGQPLMGNDGLPAPKSAESSPQQRDPRR